jgi:hypothetical protein
MYISRYLVELDSKQQTSTIFMRSVLEKDKLSGKGFQDWYRNLRIVLEQERKLYV